MDTIKTLTLANERTVPQIGQGTWFLGDDPTVRDQEISTLREGIDLGLTLVDTAEMYGGGRSENLVGEAIAPVRDTVFLVDKVLPSNASRSGTVEACERSLRALGTDYIDLYLLHWPGPHPVEETVEAFDELIERGLIGDWGVSNFDTDDVRELPKAPTVNQILYNPSRRGPEFDLIPEHRRHEPAITTMAYSPIEQGRLLKNPTLRAVADDHGVSVAQLLIAWAIRAGDVIAIPKASSLDHVRENAGAFSLGLTDGDLDRIEREFAAPQRKTMLEIL